MSRSYSRRVHFMGAHSRRLWWDIRLFGGWLVVRAGYIKRPKVPRAYWSPNGTPWHHAARGVFRARYLARQQCVCGQPDCTKPKTVAR